MHVPLTQVPRSEQSSLHESSAHVGPTHGASQAHVPLLHAPCEPQPATHVRVAQSFPVYPWWHVHSPLTMSQ